MNARGRGVQLLLEVEADEAFGRALMEPLGILRALVLMVLVLGNGLLYTCGFLCLPKASLAPLFKLIRWD